MLSPSIDLCLPLIIESGHLFVTNGENLRNFVIPHPGGNIIRVTTQQYVTTNGRKFSFDWRFSLYSWSIIQENHENNCQTFKSQTKHCFMKIHSKEAQKKEAENNIGVWTRRIETPIRIGGSNNKRQMPTGLRNIKQVRIIIRVSTLFCSLSGENKVEYSSPPGL